MNSPIARLVVLTLLSTAVAQQQPRIRLEPVPYTSPASAKQMYIAYCASCHGLSAKGNVQRHLH